MLIWTSRDPAELIEGGAMIRHGLSGGQNARTRKPSRLELEAASVI
jgi:hypothetical protein